MKQSLKLLLGCALSLLILLQSTISASAVQQPFISPATGDPARTTLYVILIVAALAILLFFLLYRRKKHK